MWSVARYTTWSAPFVCGSDFGRMKRPRQDDRRNNAKNRRIKHLRGSQSREDRVTELLKICLQKVCELQADLQRDDDQENDAEAAGYAACAMETIRFLSAEGIAPDHPIVKGLTERFMRDRD